MWRLGKLQKLFFLQQHNVEKKNEKFKGIKERHYEISGKQENNNYCFYIS